MGVDIKSAKEIEAMRIVGKMAGETLVAVGRRLRVGMTTDDINTIVHDDTIARGAKLSQLRYKGFPKSVCTSKNFVVCHGIPSKNDRLEDGDIVNVDVTSFYGGFHGDTSATFYIGTPSRDARHVVETAREALAIGMAEVREGARLGDIGAAIEEFATAKGCSVVREYGGHGIGRVFHTDPHVSHFGKRGMGMRLKAGMVFTIEPMLNLGGAAIESLDDGWTVLTADRSLSAQFEHTVLVTPTGVEALTQRYEPLVASEVCVP